MQKYFTVGELAKLQNISRQTLIFYDSIDLFKPNYTDPNNAYRYYSWEQLDYLDTIIMLKNIGMSLNDIKTFMQTYTIEQSIAALQTQYNSIATKIKELQLIQNRIHHRCNQLQQIKTLSEPNLTDITITTSNPYHLLLHEVEPPYTLDQVSIATKKLYVESAKHQLPIYLQSGAIIPYQNIMNGNYTLASHVFLPIDASYQGDNGCALQPRKCLTTYHKGSYPSIGSTYKRILDYAQKNNIEIISDSYEFAIHDYLTTRYSDQYITQILFFIK